MKHSFLKKLAAIALLGFCFGSELSADTIGVQSISVNIPEIVNERWFSQVWQASLDPKNPGRFIALTVLIGSDGMHALSSMPGNNPIKVSVTVQEKRGSEFRVGDKWLSWNGAIDQLPDGFTSEIYTEKEKIWLRVTTFKHGIGVGVPVLLAEVKRDGSGTLPKTIEQGEGRVVSYLSISSALPEGSVLVGAGSPLSK